MISRQVMTIAVTGTGPAKGDTGPAVFGELAQLRWNPSVVDTGNNAILEIAVLPKMGDTGDGFVVFNKAVGNNANWFDAPRQPATYGGLDNTTDSGFAPIVFAGDRPRYKVRSTSPIAGTLYAWFKD